jgi:hypothetical protein
VTTPNQPDSELPIPIAISPHHTQLDIGTGVIEEKIAIFADRVRGWQLDIAERLARAEQHSGFAVLAITFSYFEMIAKHEQGHVDRNPPEHFAQGARSVFAPLLLNPATGVTDEVVSKLYTHIRCQLYHEGVTGEGVVLTGDVMQAELGNRVKVEIPIWRPEGSDHVFVNPVVLVVWLQRHFSQYVMHLTDPVNAAARERFERHFG